MTGGPEGRKPDGTPGSKHNYLRRALGLAVCMSPVALLVASAGASLVLQRRSALGESLSVIGLFVAGLNLHVSTFRPLIYRWRHGTLQGLRNVSGLPLIGTLVVVLGGIVGFGDWLAAALGVLALGLDLSGLPWFLVATWRDQSFWDS